MNAYNLPALISPIMTGIDTIFSSMMGNTPLVDTAAQIRQTYTAIPVFEPGYRNPNAPDIQPSAVYVACSFNPGPYRADVR